MANRVWLMGRTATVLGVVLTGCTPPPVVAPTVSAPAVSYDGRYSGTIALTGVASGADRSWCEIPPAFGVDVVNNAFSFSYSLPNLSKLSNTGPVRYSATIAPDGSFHGQSDSTGVMQGQIAGRTMTGSIDGIACAYKFTASRP